MGLQYPPEQILRGYLPAGLVHCGLLVQFGCNKNTEV